ncbi:hypothetical protein F443_05971 [Phytophthora nicotianae P1569]|uniref:Ubiquitin-like protease family profile domain-containing protein n=1 Tax=Phytophthora nicotianae P1569 TaxID=1317065 RepID=V9FGB7_PHYNI|nr:hypothetical protein F443_05971 [Phytophthora nicotianae P1569]
MPQTGVTVQAGGVVYNVIMLKAMRSWQTAIFRFVGIESAMKWVEKYDETAWTTDDSIWTEGVADKATLIDFLKQVNVLGDIYDATGFCRETPLESSSMDLGIKAIIQRPSEGATMFTVPSEILRYPWYDTKANQNHPVWSKLKMAAASMDLSRDSSVKLFFIGVIHYDWNHWFSQDAGASTFDDTESPKRFRFTRIDLAPQLDDYNCGVFVLLFIDLQLYGVQVTGLDSESLSREAMEFFRYRHLSLILASM